MRLLPNHCANSSAGASLSLRLYLEEWVFLDDLPVDRVVYELPGELDPLMDRRRGHPSGFELLVKLFRIPHRDLIDPDSLGHNCLNLHHYLRGKRFSPAIRSKCGSVVRTKQSFLSAIAAIARSVSGKRCPLATSGRPSFAATRQSSQVGSRSCSPFSEEATQSACSSRRNPCKISTSFFLHRYIPEFHFAEFEEIISTVIKPMGFAFGETTERGITPNFCRSV